MKFSSPFSLRKGILLIIPLVLLGSYALHEAIASSGGIVGQSKAGCGGYGCHGTKSTATVISIYTDSSQIVAGKTYLFHLSVSNPSEAAAGCDISIDNAAKLSTYGYSSGLQYFVGELTHTSPRIFTGDSAVWLFNYTAPAKAGLAHIYVAGNAVNDNGTNDAGDHWNTAVETVNVIAQPGPQVLATSLVRDTARQGDTAITSISVRNIGVGTLLIDHYSLSFGTSFRIIDSSVHSIPEKESATIKIEFIPSSPGLTKDTLHIFSNDISTPTTSIAVIGFATVSSVQSKAASAFQWTVFPNPSNGRFTIHTDGISEDGEIRVSDAAGRTVFQKTTAVEDGTPVDLSMLASGTYMVFVQRKDGHSFHQQIVVAR